MRFMRYAIIGAALFVGLYFIDNATGGNMRISLVAEQFFKLATAQDDQDIAQFGSTRMAQILPKFEALVDNGKLMTGFGFLHPTKSDNPKYEFFNEYYTDWEHNYDSISNFVEVTQFNTLMHLGVLGLLVQTGYFLLIFFMLRKRGDGAEFYISTLLGSSVMGVGGFAGLNSMDGIVWSSVALATGLLVARRRAAAKDLEQRRQAKESLTTKMLQS